MKAVLMSIHHKWCELIFNGEKVVEVRKRVPKLVEPPYKVYVYEPLGKRISCRTRCENRKNCDLCSPFGCWEGAGAVIGEFVCGDVTEYEGEFNEDGLYESVSIKHKPDDFDEYGEYDYCFVSDNEEDDKPLEGSCLTWEECRKYLGKGIVEFVGLHITNAKRYDKPKDIDQFGQYAHKLVENEKGELVEGERVFVPLSRAPQGWCYVEERDD